MVDLTAPNLLTLFRIGMTPVLIYLATFIGPLPSALAAGVFFLATISDFFDGYLARSYNSGTTLGKFLDPLADKLIVTSTLIVLTGIARTPRVPAWIVAVLVAREIAVTGLRAVAASEGIVIAAEELGKYKMALQSIAIHGLLIHYTYFHLDFFAAGMFILWISMGFSIVSGIDYYRRAAQAFRGKKSAPSTVQHRAAI
ncbi:MAG TPA: CDP-diacylglycerol--glycerol-3-phosphate 3-phosphatidyltransferase [Candidatus Binataceae bacterium]